MKLSETYEIWTPEDTEFGDTDKKGFNFEEQEFEFIELVDYLKDNGYMHPSNSATIDQYTWISTEAQTIDYKTGEQEIKSLHFDGKPRQLKYWIKALTIALNYFK